MTHQASHNSPLTIKMFDVSRRDEDVRFNLITFNVYIHYGKERLNSTDLLPNIQLIRNAPLFPQRLVHQLMEAATVDSKGQCSQ